MAKNKIVTTYQNVDYPHTKKGKAALKAAHPDVYASVFKVDVEAPVEPTEPTEPAEPTEPTEPEEGE